MTNTTQDPEGIQGYSGTLISALARDWNVAINTDEVGTRGEGDAEFTVEYPVDLENSDIRGVLWSAITLGLLLLRANDTLVLLVRTPEWHKADIELREQIEDESAAAIAILKERLAPAVTH